jgi:hypothetical protein
VTLCEQVSNDVDWQVRVANDPIGLDETGGIPMVHLARRYRSANHWHIAVLITELPMRLGTVPLVADYNAEHCVASGGDTPGAAGYFVARRDDIRDDASGK